MTATIIVIGVIAAIIIAVAFFLDWLLSDPMREPTPDELAKAGDAFLATFDIPQHERSNRP